MYLKLPYTRKSNEDYVSSHGERSLSPLQKGATSTQEVVGKTAVRLSCGVPKYTCQDTIANDSAETLLTVGVELRGFLHLLAG
jgi:hypothetical protein